MHKEVTDPLLSGIVNFRELSGFSGARVLLVTRDGRHWFVRKAARDAQQSSRLSLQLKKQKAFEKVAKCSLRTPAILDEGEIDGCYFVDMEFIRGIDGVNFLRQASYAEVIEFTNQLTIYLERAAASKPLNSGGCATLFDALFTKLCQVHRATNLLNSTVLSHLFLRLDELRNLRDLNETLCHGDLTLQNMIIDDQKQIWVVDLLDSPFEHYWQDVAKLHQDLSGSWFRLKQPPIA